MVRVSFCLHRLPGLTAAEFQNYWRRMHAPLVAERAVLLRIRRYVQCHTLEGTLPARLAAARGGAPAFDGVAELWFDCLDDLFAGSDSAQVRRARRDLYEDEQRFIDLPRSPIFVGEEHEFVSKERQWS